MIGEPGSERGNQELSFGQDTLEMLVRRQGGWSSESGAEGGDLGWR